ncbi:hypothetical protein, partial [uncultured Subdoligranulum sp.]|uniref:hypothetical protein n=1 Tax=uncultured Subdoligranulum sp. TaxID=512298 RepID=UPI0026062CCE
RVGLFFQTEKPGGASALFWGPTFSLLFSGSGAVQWPQGCFIDILAGGLRLFTVDCPGGI